MPSRDKIRLETVENMIWLGRVAAAVDQWNPVVSIRVNLALSKLDSSLAVTVSTGYREIAVILAQALSDIRLRTTGPTNIAIGKGSVFDYFDEIRRILQGATADVFFVDPYLDAEFVSRFLGSIRDNVNIRLLTTDKKLGALIPSVDAFAKQYAAKIQIRSSSGLHDRYVIVDGQDCYQSGASFKDGAKQAPTTLTQIVDAFDAVSSTYEKIWNSAIVER
ncbi:hypothetical protein QO010_003378 [Caulobacter ginsengisoli]|uniref:PLD phosphodiesterase domain-containing protein n=1 Tax=Caulobacter ginsengisoli TaxID=400775 RepID=A0ABU0IUB8_9CAUL|nr:hypothetical protein [Caulobacter ginsengisoli]MDQ0465589.1 hypothetical protein [Caulobacter ginsengisoli]